MRSSGEATKPAEPKPRTPGSGEAKAGGDAAPGVADRPVERLRPARRVLLRTPRVLQNAWRRLRRRGTAASRAAGCSLNGTGAVGRRDPRCRTGTAATVG